MLKKALLFLLLSLSTLHAQNNQTAVANPFLYRAQVQFEFYHKNQYAAPFSLGADLSKDFGVGQSTVGELLAHLDKHWINEADALLTLWSLSTSRQEGGYYDQRIAAPLNKMGWRNDTSIRDNMQTNLYALRSMYGGNKDALRGILSMVRFGVHYFDLAAGTIKPLGNPRGQQYPLVDTFVPNNPITFKASTYVAEWHDRWSAYWHYYASLVDTLYFDKWLSDNHKILKDGVVYPNGTLIPSDYYYLDRYFENAGVAEKLFARNYATVSGWMRWYVLWQWYSLTSQDVSSYNRIHESELKDKKLDAWGIAKAGYFNTMVYTPWFFQNFMTLFYQTWVYPNLPWVAQPVAIGLMALAAHRRPNLARAFLGYMGTGIGMLNFYAWMYAPSAQEPKEKDKDEL